MSETNQDTTILHPRQNPWVVLNKLSIAEWLRAHGKFVRPELTKKQRLELKECFELIDADGSGAISSSEMLTAFHVLGIRTKRSEVDEMLSEVDADGSGEVEYPEFVQIMTTKMDSVTQEEEPRACKAQPLPFPLLAQAYRRKKLMEAVMQGDKATQERLQARAEEMQQERVAAIAEQDAQKNQVRKRSKTLSELTKERIRKVAKLKKKEADLPLPGYVLENIDDDVKKVLFEVHERASVRRSSMSQIEKDQKEKKGRHSNYGKIDLPSTPDLESKIEDLKRFTISNLEEEQEAILANQMHYYYKDELTKIRVVRSKLRDKPTLEQQRIKLRAVQSVGNYIQNDNKDENWNPRGTPLQVMDPAETKRINTPWRVPSSKMPVRSPSRNMSHARIVYVPPPKELQDPFVPDKRPKWINHLHKKQL